MKCINLHVQIFLGSILLSSQSQSSTICFRTYKQSKERKKNQQKNKAEEVTLRHHGLKLHYNDIQCSFLPP